LLISRRAIIDVVRTATLGSYGVAGLSGSPIERLLGWLGLASPGIRLAVRDGQLAVELFLEVGPGLPIAEVARQVDSAIRYAVRQSLGRELGPIAVHVDRLRFETPRTTGPARPSGPSDQPPAGSPVAGSELG
jgi:uncharacterized alkaline shock family protein YloU